MPESLTADLKACHTCRIGTCCYGGVELTADELKRISKSNPPVAKPWFRKLIGKERSDDEHPFATVVRNGTCVFQDKNNFCLIYDVRPHYCREFPIEKGETAPHYRQLCVLFHEGWRANDPMKNNLLKREGKNLEKKFQQIEKTIDFSKGL